jgi:quinol monooxygenase YgiN
MVQLEIIFQIWPHKQTEFIQAVKDLCDHSLNQKKGTHLGIYQALIDENLYCYLEEWDSRKNLDTHIQTERFEMLIASMKVLGEIQQAQIHEFGKTQNVRL